MFLLLSFLCQVIQASGVSLNVASTLSAVAKTLPPPTTLSEDLPGLPPGFRPFAGVPGKPSTSASSAASTSGIRRVPVANQFQISPPQKSSQIQTQKPFQPQPTPAPTPRAELSDAQVLKLVTDVNEAPLMTNEKAAYSQLFDQTAFRSWNIEMAQSDIDALNADPTLEIYYPCSITSGYGTRSAVTHSAPSFGCRYRGGVGSLRMCLNEFHQLNNDCRKLSWGFSTDAFKSKARTGIPTVHGARSLNFGGCPVDLSLMSERMAFGLLSTLNVTAPRATHAKLFLNGKYLGVYSFVQAVDSVFTRQRFAADQRRGEGDLYKELWLNKYGMQNVSRGDFMQQIMKAVDSCPLTQEAASELLQRHFDTKSFVDVASFNAIVGNTDDWRQRHNFFWYAREDKLGKKLVFIPWDYDRLYDTGSLTRGALGGSPWWDIRKTATAATCNTPIQSPEELADQTASSAGERALWVEVFRRLSPDLGIPVTCDKFTKLLALALGPRVRARTREFLSLVPLDYIRSLFEVWNQQIGGALKLDPAGPSEQGMRAEQEKLIAYLQQARSLALNQAVEGDQAYPAF